MCGFQETAAHPFMFIHNTQCTTANLLTKDCAKVMIPYVVTAFIVPIALFLHKSTCVKQPPACSGQKMVAGPKVIGIGRFCCTFWFTSVEEL